MRDKETMIILKIGKHGEMKSKNHQKDVWEAKPQKDDNESDLREISR